MDFFFHFRNHTRIMIEEVILPYGECINAITLSGWTVIFLSTLFWIFRLIRFFYHAVQYYDIKKFFNSALKIDDVSFLLYASLSITQMRVDAEWTKILQMCWLLHFRFMPLPSYETIFRFCNSTYHHNVNWLSSCALVLSLNSATQTQTQLSCWSNR